jgi:hypothetical protein
VSLPPRRTFCRSQRLWDVRFQRTYASARPEVVAAECEPLAITLPCHYEHAYDQAKLECEQKEYALADGLLCHPSFVGATSLATAHALTWDTAGDELLAVYSKLVDVGRVAPALTGSS